jgi:hypothetical protein
MSRRSGIFFRFTVTRPNSRLIRRSKARPVTEGEVRVSHKLKMLSEVLLSSANRDFI